MPKKKSKKAKSQSQRNLFGWAYACAYGKQKNCPDQIKDLGTTFKTKYPEDLEAMAKTKHKGLPKKVKKESLKWIKTFEEYYSDEDYNCPECGCSETVPHEGDCDYWSVKCADCGHCYETPDV